jgi:hypothetical protein
VDISAFLSAYYLRLSIMDLHYFQQESSLRGNLSECVRQHAAVYMAVFRSTSDAMIHDCVGIFKQSMGARNRVGMGYSTGLLMAELIS